MAAIVTDRDSAVCSAQLLSPPAERETPAASSQTVTIPVHSAVTERVRAVLDDITPPAVWRDAPASLAELSTYARSAAWTSQQAGFVRGLGIWWCRLIGIPVTVACRYLEWVAQRPGRAGTVAILIAFFWLGR